MGRKNKRKKTIINVPADILAWRKFFNEKFPEQLRWENIIRYAWYNGKSDLLEEAYSQADRIVFNTSSDNKNHKDYFWALAAREPDIKKTHSGLVKVTTKTLINVLGTPEIKIMTDGKDENGQYAKIEDEATQNRLEEILKENDYNNLVRYQQLPLSLNMGDGVFLVNVDEEISDYPILEYVDARNCAFEFAGNKVSKVYTRSYYNVEYISYCLLQERGTIYEKGARMAYIKYNLFRLSNQSSREIMQEVALSTVPELANLEDVVITNIDTTLAVPCIYAYDKIIGRGTPLFNEKFDLLDDLDQSLSQGSNSVRLSTPVEEIDESAVEHDSEGKPLPPQRYDRRYIVVKGNVNTVGQNPPVSNLVVPQIDFAKYSVEQQNLICHIILGIISPSTLGINVSRVDNGEAQREKEKHTMFTRDEMVEFQSVIMENLCSLLLKVHDVMEGRNPGNYDITINFPEYGNPTFESKLNNLSPAVTTGAMSPKRYVEELWGDSLTDEEKEEEIEYITAQQDRSATMEPAEVIPGSEGFGGNLGTSEFNFGQEDF